MDVTTYIFLLILLGVALAFPLLPLALARLWAGSTGLSKPGPEKNASYECGVRTPGPARIQFKSQYYHYGIVFLLFDVEAAFLLPFAVAFLDLPVGAFIAMMVFVLLLLEGLVWAWARGILAWK